ncbi:hypothetical protein JCM6882_009086 [Rhodosporidiobolus microsporus]
MLQPRLSRSLQRLSYALRPQNRTLWHTSTLVSPSPSALLAHISSNPPPAASTATVYALSKNTPQDLVPSFRAALAPKDRDAAVGCLSEVLPPSLISSLAPSLPSSSSETFSLTVASFVPSAGSSERAVAFRSSLTGRPNVSVGREIKPEADEDGDDSGFEAFLRGEKWGFGDSKNARKGEASEGIEDLKGVDPKNVSQLLCFTADRLQPFLSALSAYPSASTAGLVGSSTPFHSPAHDPYSLFLGPEETFASGAVGVAIVRDGPAKTGEANLETKLEYGGLELLGKPMEVTSSRGNIVLTLSSQNAARTLLNYVNELFGTSAQQLSAIERSEEKEKEFYAAVFEGEEPSSTPDLSKAKLVAKIMAGDPSRGAMSVETEEEVKQGSWLAFLHRPSSQLPSSSYLPTPPPPNSLTFLSLPASYTSPHFSASECAQEGEVVVLDGFVAASENGVVHAGGTGRGVVCGVEGARAVVQ